MNNTSSTFSFQDSTDAKPRQVTISTKDVVTGKAIPVNKIEYRFMTIDGQLASTFEMSRAEFINLLRFMSLTLEYTDN